MGQKYYLIISKNIIQQILLKSSSLITITIFSPACSGCPNLHHFAVLMDASVSSSPLTRDLCKHILFQSIKIYILHNSPPTFFNLTRHPCPSPSYSFPFSFSCVLFFFKYSSRKPTKEASVVFLGLLGFHREIERPPHIRILPPFFPGVSLPSPLISWNFTIENRPSFPFLHAELWRGAGKETGRVGERGTQNRRIGFPDVLIFPKAIEFQGATRLDAIPGAPQYLSVAKTGGGGVGLLANPRAGLAGH